MKKITLKQLLFVFGCLMIAINAYSAVIDIPQVMSHQKAIMASVGSNVDFKFEVTSDGGASILGVKAYYMNRYDPKRRIEDPYTTNDIHGNKCYYISLYNVQEENEGDYYIEVINKAGAGSAGSSLMVVR